MANPTSECRVERTELACFKADGCVRAVMRKDKIFILVVFALVVGAAVGIQQLQWLHDDPAPQPAGGPGREIDGRAVPLKPVPVEQMRGFSLKLDASSSGRRYEKLVDEIAATGANTVCLVLSAYQENCDSTSIFVDARRTPSDSRLKKLVVHARQAGLRVVVMPIILLENPRAGEWRGKIKPKSWDDWWEDYNNYILHYARVCQQAGVEMLVVGSELISTEKNHAGRWRGLIRQVRGLFKGYLSYSANWDHYRPVSWCATWTSSA